VILANIPFRPHHLDPEFETEPTRACPLFGERSGNMIRWLIRGRLNAAERKLGVSVDYPRQQLRELHSEEVIVELSLAIAISPHVSDVEARHGIRQELQSRERLGR
jgi:hypothetical protein